MNFAKVEVTERVSSSGIYNAYMQKGEVLFGIICNHAITVITNEGFHLTFYANMDQFEFFKILEVCKPGEVFKEKNS